MATYSGQLRGLWRVLRTASAQLRGLWRVAETALDRYELYVGQDASPDLTGAPDATSATLPFESAALAAGHTYYLVVRERNEFGLSSENVGETVLEIDAGGNEVGVRPSPPYDVTAEAAAAGAVRVRARYNYLADGDDAADTWAIWQTSDGTEPDPTGAADATVAMVRSDGVAKLDWTSGAFADGLTVKTLVRARNGSLDSTNTTSVSCEAETDGPAAPGAGAFLGTIDKQGE